MKEQKMNGLTVLKRIMKENKNKVLVKEKSNVNTSKWGWDCWQDSHRC